MCPAWALLARSSSKRRLPIPPQTIVITGASDGIGAASARHLHSKGEHVVLVGRSHEKTAAVAAELGGAPFFLADFATLADVRRLADELRDSCERIDVLANNAGAIMAERRETADGHEMTFQVNHLAPFLLTRLLMPTLIASRAKVIQTSSRAANVFGQDFDVGDLENARGYSSSKAYGYAKLENVLFTRELQRRHGADGIAAVAFHPGVVRTSFANDTDHYIRFLYHTPLKYLATISPDKGGAALTWLAEGTPGRDWTPGEIYAKNKPYAIEFQDPDGAAARRLWSQSEQMVGAHAT